jgi:transposase-like protein
VKSFAEALMGAEADTVCGAALRERSGERVNRRNGYLERPFDTLAGTIALAVPTLRSGSYFPDWLVERRRRGQRALVAAVGRHQTRASIALSIPFVLPPARRRAAGAGCSSESRGSANN